MWMISNGKRFLNFTWDEIHCIAMNEAEMLVPQQDRSVTGECGHASVETAGISYLLYAQIQAHRDTALSASALVKMFSALK